MKNWFSSLVTSNLTAATSFQQESPALLVTRELDKALSDCKAKVDRISKDCRAKNRKFRDVEFDLENDRDRCLHGLKSPVYMPSDVQRATQIFENPQFFVDGADSNDIVQGALADCWLLSALAVLSTAPGLIEKFCVARDEKVGVYGFIFFRDAAWVTVIIDDMLYTSIPKYDELTPTEKRLYHNDKDTYNRSARKNGKGLYFARSGTHGETWVPLIEKAFAKLHGNYFALHMGNSCEAVEDLTGGVSSVIPTKDILDIDKFWNDELLQARKDRLFGCSFLDLDTNRSGASSLTMDGLIGGHAYSVLRAVEVKGKRFVVIRNPWGDSEWTGRWSDGSKEWDRKWLEALPALGHGFGDDGQFVMEYSDFIECWEEIERTRLFDSTWVMSSQFLRVPARPLPCAWGYGDVSFTVSLPAPTFAIIVLSELDDRYFNTVAGRFEWAFDFILYKKGQSEVIGESSVGRFHTRSVNLEMDLEAGEYVLHVRLDRRLSSNALSPPPPMPYDDRKLSRVLTERAKSQSLARNFHTIDQARNLPIPMDILAGRDLSEVSRSVEPLSTADFFPTPKAPLTNTQAAPAEGISTKSITLTETISRTTTIETTDEVAIGTDPDDTPVQDYSKTLSLSGSESDVDDDEGTPAPRIMIPGISPASRYPISRPTRLRGADNDTSEDGTHPEDDVDKISIRPPSRQVDRPDDRDYSGLALLRSPSVQSNFNGPMTPDSEDNAVFLGLRVYTNKKAPAVIGSQLRKGGDDLYQRLVFGKS